MKTLIRLFLPMALTILSSSTHALADIPKGSDIPADQWEINYNMGIALDMILYRETTQDNKQVNHLILYIKNISTTNKQFIPWGVDDGIIFFYTDGQGVRHNLRPPRPYTNFTNVTEDIFHAGEVLPEDIKINSDELTFVTSHPIQCNFRIYDSATQQKYEITSQPKTLLMPQ